MSGLSAEVVDVAFEVDMPPHGRRTILDIPQLILSPGRLAAISGPSGSGKSTLLYLLAGLLVPQRGQILWAGSDLARQSEAQRDRWRLDNAGFVFQSFNLVDELSPLDNVLLPAWFANIGVRNRRERAKALLKRFGVPDGANRVALLSRGEQQRVAVARALLFDPKVIFADEPTASLDAAAGALIARELRSLASEHGKTVIVASHDRTVLDLADRVVALERGRVVTQPTIMAA
jgi:ABC-type lipoprotein export system ATPase subunit